MDGRLLYQSGRQRENTKCRGKMSKGLLITLSILLPFGPRFNCGTIADITDRQKARTHTQSLIRLYDYLKLIGAGRDIWACDKIRVVSVGETWSEHGTM